MQSRPPIDPHAAGSTAVPGTVRVAAPEGAPALPPRTSWGAIIAGAVVALTVGLMLNTLGVAVGATAVDAVSRDTPSASTFGIGAGLWLVVSNLIGLAVGGYVAARFSGTADDTDAMLHGLGVWAVTSSSRRSCSATSSMAQPQRCPAPSPARPAARPAARDRRFPPWRIRPTLRR